MLRKEPHPERPKGEGPLQCPPPHTRDKFRTTGELAEREFKTNLTSHYGTTRTKLQSELAEVERAMSTALTLATPQEKIRHEELHKTTKDNILKGEERLKENKSKKLENLRAPPQVTTTTPPTRGGSRGRGGRRGAGRGRPRPSRRTPYQYQQMETMIDKIIERIEQRRGGRSPKPRRPPRESTHRRRPHGSGGARAQTQH